MGDHRDRRLVADREVVANEGMLSEKGFKPPHDIFVTMAGAITTIHGVLAVSRISPSVLQFFQGVLDLDRNCFLAPSKKLHHIK